MVGLSHPLRRVARMLIPRRCPLCDEPGPAPCGACRAGLRHAGRVPPVAELDSIAALYAYEGAVRQLLLALKYRNRRDALRWLGAELAATVVDPVDAVTWAPTGPRRAARRGYDQAELLARAVARSLRRPARAVLRRTSSVAQTGLDAAARRHAPAFTVRRRVTGAWLLVDDVCTTGATLTAAARCLRAAGATTVHAVVVARTPRANAWLSVAGLAGRADP